jgi:hypothetical protein
MSRGPVSWKESDVKRAIKAARESGLPIARLEMKPSGEIAVVIGKPAECPSETKPTEGSDEGWDTIKLADD